MFGKIGAGELILILIVALVVVGPTKLPELGKAVGKTLNEFKKFSNDVKEDFSLTEKTEKVEKSEKTEKAQETIIIENNEKINV